MESSEKQARKQRCLSVDMSSKLLGQVEELRRIFQDGSKGPRMVSRSDVMRLGLRRLMLAYLVHQVEMGKGTDHVRERYLDLWLEIQMDACCPDWLVPGHGEPVKKDLEPKKKATPRRAGKRRDAKEVTP